MRAWPLVAVQAFFWTCRQLALRSRRGWKRTGSQNRYVPLGAYAIKGIYFENDDILQIRMSNKPIVREVSQDWHTNINYAEDGTIVEIVLIDAKKEGLLPVEFKKVA